MDLAFILEVLAPSIITAINGGVNEQAVMNRIAGLKGQGLTLEQLADALKDWDASTEADLQKAIDAKKQT